MPAPCPLPASLDDRTRRVIDAAVTEADQGRFGSVEAIDAWMDSWGEADVLAPPEPIARRRDRRGATS